MRVALVHDYLIQYGGAERVLEQFAQLFPDAPIYTLLYDKAASGYAFEGREIRTSFLQKFPRAKSFYKFLALLMPIAIENFDLRGYDLILSSSASYAKGVLTDAKSLHICYCHTPMRYAWLDYKKIAGDSFYPLALSRFIPFLTPYLRFWDRISAARPDYYLCNSNFVKNRIAKYYRREAVVVYPPVNFSHYAISAPQNYFLMSGRLVPYKRFDIAIKAFNELGFPLKIMGAGPQYHRLKKMAKTNIEFVGLVSEHDLSRHYAQAQALIFPQEEDFGIAALESMAAGRPVIAYGAGGALESIIEGQTGHFFYEQTPQALKNAVLQFTKMQFDPERIRAHAQQFDRGNFRRVVAAFVEKKFQETKCHYTI